MTPQAVSSTVVQLTSPSLQWWRIIFVFAIANTSSNVGSRGLQLAVNVKGRSSAVLTMTQPAGIPADNEANATWGPGITTYSSTAVSGQVLSAVGIPDVIYPPQTQIVVAFFGSLAGDTMTPPNVTYAIEVFAESAGGELVPAAGLSASPVVV